MICAKQCQRILIVLLFVASAAFSHLSFHCACAVAAEKDKELQWYLDFFAKVYDTMRENYYQPVNEEAYGNFVKKFREGIYVQLKAEGRSNDYVRWRATAFLVENLKSPEDRFSAFFPPQFAERYAHEVLGQRVDLGIEGELSSGGLLIKRVEPRSDAYIQGLREGDLILKIGRKDILKFTKKEIEDRLTPLINTKVHIEFWSKEANAKKSVDLLSQEYFKQTVFMKPVPVPHVFCLEIRSFNRKTSEDLFRFLSYIEQQGDSGLVLDLRGNPGGPPLAAREISAFFLGPGEAFAYFQKTGQPRAILDVPSIPEQYQYKGPVAILVNKESGSAAELFTGIMQRRNRAFILGTNTAGQVFLKSMFNFDDKSMLLLITSRGYYSDGSTFSFQGVEPNRSVDDPQKDLVVYAALYLNAVMNNTNKTN